jgi:hypothetical protein
MDNGPTTKTETIDQQVGADGAVSRLGAFVLMLPERRRRTKEEVDQAQADEKASWSSLSDLLYEKGIALNDAELIDFCIGIRGCFDEVIVGSYRQGFLQSVKQTLTGNHPEIFVSIGKAIPTISSNITKWKNGAPITFDMLFLFFAASDFPMSDIRFPGAVSVIRSAVARALTYIRVYPPAIEFVEAGGDFTQRDAECWSFIRRHRLFISGRPLPREILDEVERRYPDLTLKANDVPMLKSVMDGPRKDLTMIAWFDHWLIFKHATSFHARIFWLWESIYPQYAKIWSQDGN